MITQTQPDDPVTSGLLGWRRSLWVVLLAALIVLPNWFAIQQYRATGGYLFYSNAFDEPTYLSYDGARMAKSITHSAEYLVVGLHMLGVSGGYINLVFDVVLPVVTVILLRRIAIALGFSTLESIVYPFVVVAVPVLFGYSNPYYSRVFNLNYYSRGLSWITLPQAYYPPFFRTPEPQLSLAVVALASYLAIRRHSYVIALAVIPLIYPFVGIGYMFVVVGMLVHDRLGPFVEGRASRVAAAMLVSYVATAGMILAFYLLFVRKTTLADFLPATHMPLLSGTGAVAIVLYLLARTRLEARYQVAALLLAVAPIAAANTQLISGFIQAPHNLEQNFGVVALALVGVLAMRAVLKRPWMVVLAAAASCWLLGQYSAHVFAVNPSMVQRAPLSNELLDALRSEPESVVIGDPDLADVFALIAPRVHFSALARSQTLRSQDDSSGDPTTSDRFENYLCVKRLVSQANIPDEIAPAAFDTLDHEFRYLRQDFPLIHLNRKDAFRPYFDPSEAPHRCAARQLKIFPAFVLGERIYEARVSQSVVTPQQQWSYASMQELTERPAAEHAAHGWVDVQVTITVTRGCLGVGVLAPDQRAFVIETAVARAGRAHVANLPFTPLAKPHWLVVRNCSPDGPSTGMVHAVQMFPVERVTVRSVAAALAPSGQP